MDQPKVERLLRLMKMLTANVEYTVDDIAERLGMSRRTIYRYIDTFREAGFVVRKTGDCIRLDKASPHFKDISQLVHFTEEEAVILRRAIESIDDTNMLKMNLKRKLYTLYDSRALANTVVRGGAATTVHRLVEAIEEHRCVVLHDYRSPRGVRDRRVEPYAFTTNYVNVWCYDCEARQNKIFKTSRIGSVELLDEMWSCEEWHDEGFIDVFRMISNDGSRIHVRLLLSSLARSLLVEEYPLAEPHISACDDGWLFEADVANMQGVGRFVAGLLDNIRVVDSPELQEYLKHYITAFGTLSER